MTKVAVVIPVHNRASTLARAIESAVRAMPDEVVVVDDASTDASREVAARYGARLVCHDQKAANWVEALGQVYESLDADYVIGMGADDVLYGPLADVVRLVSASRPGVIWSDYELLREGTPPVRIETRRFGFEAATALTAEQTASRFMSLPAWRNECGVGSAIRRDLLCWLHGEEYWRLGPWSDSFGYVIAALRAGCVYGPDVHGGFVVQQAAPSYHQQALLDWRKMAAFQSAAEAWLSRPQIAAFASPLSWTLQPGFLELKAGS